MHISLSFPSWIMTAPDIRVVAFDEKLAIESKKAIAAANKRVCLQYDTTFNLTDYYVSSLTYIHPLLHNSSNVSPPIPLGQLFHEKKHEESHDYFWQYVYKNFPEFDDKAFLVTDCEDGLRNAARKYFPNMPILRCWNHLWQSVERWIRGKGGKVC